MHNQLENLKNQDGICFETNRLLKAGFEKERLTTLRSADQVRSIGQNESRLSQIKNVQIVSLKRKIEAFKESTSIDGYNKKCKTLVSKLEDITNKIKAFLLGYAAMPVPNEAAPPF